MITFYIDIMHFKKSPYILGQRVPCPALELFVGSSLTSAPWKG